MRKRLAELWLAAGLVAAGFFPALAQDASKDAAGGKPPKPFVESLIEKYDALAGSSGPKAQVKGCEPGQPLTCEVSLGEVRLRTYFATPLLHVVEIDAPYGYGHREIIHGMKPVVRNALTALEGVFKDQGCPKGYGGRTCDLSRLIKKDNYWESDVGGGSVYGPWGWSVAVQAEHVFIRVFSATCGRYEMCDGQREDRSASLMRKVEPVPADAPKRFIDLVVDKYNEARKQGSRLESQVTRCEADQPLNCEVELGQDVKFRTYFASPMVYTWELDISNAEAVVDAYRAVQGANRPDRPIPAGVTHHISQPVSKGEDSNASGGHSSRTIHHNAKGHVFIREMYEICGRYKLCDEGSGR